MLSPRPAALVHGELAALAAVSRRVLVLANPRAGARNPQRLVDQFAEQLHLHGLDPTVCWQREEFAARVTAERESGLRCVVAAGGDGTLLEVVNRAPGVPVALLPVGTENVVARYWRMPRSPAKVARLVASGHIRQLDMARAGGRLFCIMASAGLDADVVARLHHQRHGHINHLSYLNPILATLWEYSYPRVEVEVLDNGERLAGTHVFLFNLPCYALRLPLAAGARADDGLLDLVVFERKGAWNVLRYLAAVVGGGHEKLPDCHHRRVRAVRLTASEPVWLQTDGDPEGRLPLTIAAAPRELQLLVP